MGGDDGGFNSWGTLPVAHAGDAWAFLDANSERIAIHDVTTGALTRTVDLVSALANGDPRDEDDEDDDDGFGTEPGVSAMARTPSGALVVAIGSPRAGDLAIVDGQTGRVTAGIHAAVCP